MADAPALIDIWGNRLRGLGPSPWTHSVSQRSEQETWVGLGPLPLSPQKTPNPPLSPKGEASGGGEGLDSIRTNKATPEKTLSGVQCVGAKAGRGQPGRYKSWPVPCGGEPYSLPRRTKGVGEDSVGTSRFQPSFSECDFQPAPPALNSWGLLQTLNVPLSAVCTQHPVGLSG